MDENEAMNFVALISPSTWTSLRAKLKIFDYGTNEYANDATNAQGWYYSSLHGLYGKFAQYSNTLAAMAKERDLQPIANDGFYYEDKDDVEFDKDVIISYWSSR